VTEYLVLGAGAIGGSLAHYLARSGHAVTVVDADAEHVAAIRSHGIVLVDPVTGEEDAALVAAAHTPEELTGLGTLTRVLLATKSHHVADAAAWLAPMLPEDGAVLLCQNGDTFGLAAESLGADRVLSAFVNFAADVVAPGRIRSGGPGMMVIGERRGDRTDRVAVFVEDLRGFGEVEASDDVEGYLWSKRGIAAVLSATSLVDEHTATVIDEHRDVMSAVVSEVVAVTRAEGIALHPFDGIDAFDLTVDADPDARRLAFDALVRFTGSLPGKERSGVFRDLAVRRRPTEARPELRSVIAAGERHGIEAPHLRRLERLLGEIEAGERGFGRANLAELAVTN